MTNAHRYQPLLAVLSLLLAACTSSMPARVDTVNGQQVEVATAGSGSPTVVFEAGLGNDLSSWDQVAPEVAHHTQVFAYSRQGYGASGPLRTSRDPQVIVEELRALLTAEGYAPPYILVGHSMGGTYMELFAKLHRDEVAGVVLLDPRHRDLLRTCEAAQLDNCGIPESVLLQQGPSLIAEYQAFELASDEIRAAGLFGSYPVRVLIATNHDGWSRAHETLWASLLGDLAAEAPDGAALIEKGSSHNIEVDRPDDVIQTIVSLLP